MPAYTKSDIWVFLAIVPLQVILCNRILLGKLYYNDLKVFLAATGIFFATMLVIFIMCGAIALRFLKVFPGVHQNPQRLLLSVLSYMTLTVGVQTPIMLLYDKIDLLQYTFVSYVDLRIAVISALGNVIITIIFEGLAAFERWKATLFETEQLKKENLKSQLQSLKNQINPHFLFNSINSLSSLIGDDPERAEEFLDEMSKVYRYLLRNNEDNLIPLSMELQFIHSYYHLLKTRYGDAIYMDIHVSEMCSEFLLPPLTLQILVENAVKHNIILKEQPLRIEIVCTNNEQLTVKNNLQRKTVKVESTNIGLQNIAAKYQLLNEPDISINETAFEFAVTVPLIEAK